jgi:hypothetical protein
MLNVRQTPTQARIEYTVTNGLGYNKTNYLTKGSVYEKYLCEDEVKNTNKGLKSHLFEMNFDRQLARYFRYRSNGSIFGRIKSRFYYANLQLKYDNLKGNAVNEAVYNRGGLMSMIIQHKMIKDNLANILLAVNNKD